MVASCSDDDDKIEDVYKPYDPEQGYNSPIETKASESYYQDEQGNKVVEYYHSATELEE